MKAGSFNCLGPNFSMFQDRILIVSAMTDPQLVEMGLVPDPDLPTRSARRSTARASVGLSFADVSNRYVHFQMPSRAGSLQTRFATRMAVLAGPRAALLEAHTCRRRANGPILPFEAQGGQDGAGRVVTA